MLKYGIILLRKEKVMSKFKSSILVAILIFGALFYIKEHPLDSSVIADKVEESTQNAAQKASETDIDDITSVGDRIANYIKKILGRLGYEENNDTSNLTDSLNLSDVFEGSNVDVVTLTDEELDEVTLVRVVDGDTIVVDNDGTQEKVRLLEVNSPESVHSDASKNNEYGEMASA